MPATLALSGTSTIATTIDVSDTDGLTFASGTTVNITAGGLLGTPIFSLGSAGTTGVQVNVAAGGTLHSVGLTASAGSESVRIGEAAGSQAAIAVSGLGASLDSGGWAIDVGDRGSGTLALAEGASITVSGLEPNNYPGIAVGVSFGSTGLITVASGAVLDSGAARLTVGEAGTGQVVVQGGTVLAASSSYSDNESALALGFTLASDTLHRGTGMVTVDGAGSVIRANGRISVGQDGSGTMLIENGGAVLQIGTSPDSYEGIAIGRTFGAVGTLEVTSAGTLDSGVSTLVVGEAGTGTLLVQGGTVLASSIGYSDVEAALVLGWSLSSDTHTGTGMMTVDGTGSVVRANGRISVGQEGSGTLLIANGGTVLQTGTLPSNYEGVAIGRAFGAVGTIEVASGGSLDSGVSTLVVGDAGTGTLLVQGGTVLASSLGYADTEAALVLGWSLSGNPTQTGTGIVTVDGAGSVIRADGAVWVGESGAGSVTVSNAGTVTVTASAALLNDGSAILVGDDAGATGQITVTGAQSQLDGGVGRLSIGNNGQGSVSVLQGGTVTASAAESTSVEPAVRLGNHAGSQGTLTIGGAGSTLSANGAVWVGRDGSGTLTVSGGGAVSAGGTNDGGTGLVVAAGTGAGSVRLDSGSLTISDNAQVNASGTVTLNAGTLAVAGTLNVAAGAAVTGDGKITGDILDDGLINATGLESTLELTGAITGTGTIAVAGEFENNDTMILDGSVAAGVTLAFADLPAPAVSSSKQLVELATPLGMHALIKGFDVHTEITFAGAYTTVASHFSGNTLEVTGDGAVIADFTFDAGHDDANTFAIKVGTSVSVVSNLPCFLAGTPILTTRGEVAVEDLRVGDHVVTLSGRGNPLKPIVWIGSSRFDAAHHPRPDQVVPIRITAGALAEGLPHTDLLVSPGHALLLDGVLIQAERLVNGATILRDNRITRGTYFHVELDQHDILLSAGVPSESYLDIGNRLALAHGGEVVEMYPDFSPKACAETCLPLVQEGPRLSNPKTRLLQRAFDAGFDITQDHDLHVIADGVALRPAAAAEGTFVFMIPGGSADIGLASRTWVPSELQPDATDMRRLGVFVSRLLADGIELPLGAPRLCAGWHDVESDGASTRRWTSGVAALPAGIRILSVTLWSTSPYWAHGASPAALPVARRLAG